MIIRSRLKLLSLLLAVLMPAARAYPQQSASAAESVPGVTASAHTAPPVVGHVFAFPVASKSAEAQKLVEVALNQYENVLLDKSVDSAKLATKKDPQFALAYAVWSFAARRSRPDSEVTRKAEQLAVHAPADERLLVRFMTSVQKDDLLPAITAMNDLLARFPQDRHALYLTAEWLYFQQDYERSIRMFEQITRFDPNFAPAFNMLGYANVEAEAPNPERAIANLKRYAELEPNNPNPEDSLGEVSRYVGDDQGSIAHYRAALAMSPTFFSSQIGLGDTYTMMGDFAKATAEYRKALVMATNDRDRLHVDYQMALMKFWQGNPTEGLRSLDSAAKKANAAHDPYAQFEILEGRALLEPVASVQIEKLAAMEKMFNHPVEGMSEADRNPSLASVWRDQVRVLAENKNWKAAEEIMPKLESLAKQSRDLLVENCYESSRGYIDLAQENFAGATDQLSADPRSPLAFKWLVVAREKSGDGKGAEAARQRLKYLRAPLVEWYLATRVGSPAN